MQDDVEDIDDDGYGCDDYLSSHSILNWKYLMHSGQKGVECVPNHLKRPNLASLVEIDAF